MRLTESRIADLAAALSAGEITATALAALYLNRIAAYEHHGPALNAVPVLNPDLFAEARASDLRRAAGKARGPLDGIPYTAKNSFMVRGLTVAAGSPAFRDLIAREDAFAIEQLRAAGAVLIGLTNMPPMANGGMQRGLYGRAESPWNKDYLTSAFGSGSSSGSGSATAAAFAAFGLGEETWSSGRAPAANNGLCAYTPSRGMISVRGNWPLVPTMDVVVPHTRNMADMRALLEVLLRDDPRSEGDFWRAQPWISLPRPSDLRAPADPLPEAAAGPMPLAGRKFGLPAMYINADPRAGEPGARGIGGPTGQKILTRPWMLSLTQAACAALRAAGAEIVITDFPVISRYEGDRHGAPTLADAGLVSPAFLQAEITSLSAWAWDDFLRRNDDPQLNRLGDVDGAEIFPHPEGALPDRYTGFDDRIAEYPALARAGLPRDFRDIPELEAGLKGLEHTRKADFEAWMEGLGLDAVLFPALADIGPADADVNPASADLAWRNGCWVANGNLAIRHLGIPTVTLPMGILPDIAMPAGLTFAGRAWDDMALLALALTCEGLLPALPAAPLTPELPPPPDPASLSAGGGAPLELALQITGMAGAGERLQITGTAYGQDLWLTVCGQTLAADREGHHFSASLPMPQSGAPLLVIALSGGCAAFCSISGPEAASLRQTAS